MEAQFGGKVLNDGGRSVGGWDVILDIIQVSSGTAYFPAHRSSTPRTSSGDFVSSIVFTPFLILNKPVGLVLLCCCRSNPICFVEQHNISILINLNVFEVHSISFWITIQSIFGLNLIHFSDQI